MHKKQKEEAMLNMVGIMGRLVKEPELRHTDTHGIPVTTFTLAVEGYHKGNQEETYFIDVIAWRTNAECVCKYFTKGLLIAVNGYLQSRNYTDVQGNKRKSVEVVAQSVHFVERIRTKASEEPPPAEVASCESEEDGLPAEDDLPF